MHENTVIVKLKRMGHAALHVKSVPEAIRFYTEVLGLQENWVGDPDWANLKLGPDDLSLVRQEGHRHPPHLGFRIDSLEALETARKELLGVGLRPGAITHHRDGTASFYFRDPDANILEILWDPTDK